MTITRNGEDNATKRVDKRNKGALFENFASFTDCISKINNTQVCNTKYLNVLMPLYNLIEYSNNYIQKHQEVYDNIIEMIQLVF